jgi:arylsulfatase B
VTRTVWLVAAGAVGAGLAWWAWAPAPAAGLYVAPPVSDGSFRPNFLLLVADDIGQDNVRAYNDTRRAAPMPHLDALAAEGLVFDHAIANPVCSPTRGTLMTGRYAYRYGIGNAIPPRKGWGLPESEVILPRVLKEKAGYSSAIVGKWHLATPDVGGLDHARKLGFDHHSGTMGNLLGKVPATDKAMTYYHWPKVVDGAFTEVSDEYITSVAVDDAINFSASLAEPWFLYVAFHSAHFPMHMPPEDHFTQEVPKYPTEPHLYRLMIESLDHEIGRLLDGIDPAVLARTNILFMGDNGSAPVGVLPPWPKGGSKGALLRGGIRVPFILAGPSVVARGERTDALVNTTDLFATVLELAGIEAPLPEDTVSFASVLRDPSLSPRDLAYAEHFAPNGMGPWEEQEVAIRDHRYKLIVTNGKPGQMFDLQEDPFEQRNLLVGEPAPELVRQFKRLKYALPDSVKLEHRPTAEEVTAAGFDPAQRL